MIFLQVLALFLAIIVPCASQYAPGFGCNDTFLISELHKCEKTMLQALIDDPSANCGEEVKKLQQCSRKLIVDKCYSSLYALYPKLREAVEEMMDVTLTQVNKASFYCSDHKMKINWEMIPNAVKKVLPCNKKFFEESLKCAEKFRVAFNRNKKDPNLCRLYTETKRCSHRVSYIYCTSSTILSVNKLNPFCEGGMDLEEMSNDKSIKKPLKCVEHQCSNSSSPFFPAPSCAPPREITCEAPEGFPFEYDACMTTRLRLEPSAGVILTQVSRNCSSSYLCNSSVFCNAVGNSTGMLKSCDVQCCTGELCNKDSLSEVKSKLTKPTEPTGSSLKCISSTCTKLSSALIPNLYDCGLDQEITCDSPPDSPFIHDRCMTTSVLMEPIAGVTVKQDIRNCSFSFLCEPNRFCDTVNTTGLVKKCDFQCCKGNLCNKRILTKPTPIVQPVTTKQGSSLRCISSICSKSSSALIPNLHDCGLDQEITCDSPSGSSLIYDRCMTASMLMEPIAGVTVEQEFRNCSFSFLCDPKRFCDAVNMTGLVKKCDFQCCKGNLCNKKTPAKPTPIVQPVTTKQAGEVPKESQPKVLKGFWTRVTPTWISGYAYHGIRVKYRSVNKGLVIEGHVTSYGCHRKPGSGLTTFIKGNWTQIMYTQEFQGSASCWRIFGNSGRKGGYKRIERSGLQEFDPRKGDIIFNELKMGGKNDDAFRGRTHMCDQPAKNFWHVQNGLGLRRATVMLRRKASGNKAGIHTATSCGQPSFVIKDIFVYH